VLLVEMAPVLFESNLVVKRWPAAPRIGHQIHKLTPIIAVVGLALSLLHQSSLGATYGVIAARPLWYKPSLPVLFILSAVAGGLSITLLGTLIVSQLRGRPMVAKEAVRDMAILAGAAMLAYLYLKLWDWAATTYYSNITAREQVLSVLRQTTPYGETFWWIEVLLGGLVPAVIFLWPRLRENRRLLMLACGLAIAGVVMTRWNVTISGLVVPQDWSPGVAFLFPRLTYAPTLPELGAFLGIIAYALLGFTLGVRYLPIYPSPEGEMASSDDKESGRSPTADDLR
jgi:molybdopterin-containing oxidoreductase family membrane subunit